MRLSTREAPLPAPLAPSSGEAPGSRLSADLRAELLGGGERAEGNRALLEQSAAQVVVCGQQPGFPAPLGLTLQKAATAIALAASLSQSSGRAHVPLFWCAGDDSDFDEARGQWLEREGRSPLRVSLPEAQRRKGAFVGDLDPGPAWAEVRTRYLPRVPELLDSLADEDLAAREMRILAGLFAPWGLLLLDARSETLRRDGAPLFKLYAERRSEFSLLLDEEGDRLEDELGRRPLRSGLGERALFFLRRRRRHLPPTTNYADELASRLQRDPGSLSPNASLRPLLQDAVLPVAAAVLGPGEWSYHLQIRKLFDLMELPFPRAVARLNIMMPEESSHPLLRNGRESSPLLGGGRPMGHPLADPVLLVEAARRHLELWETGRYRHLILEGD